MSHIYVGIQHEDMNRFVHRIHKQETKQKAIEPTDAQRHHHYYTQWTTEPVDLPNEEDNRLEIVRN